MSKSELFLWKSGVNEETPLPPMINFEDVSEISKIFLDGYRKLGPIFRVPRPTKPLTVLAGPDVNLFVARYGNEFFATGEIWQGFDESVGTGQTKGKRDGEANKQRRARIGRSFTRARVLEQIPLMMQITHDHARTWPIGQSVGVLAALQRIIAEQLGQLLVRHELGDYLPDVITFLRTNVASFLGMQDKDALTTPEYLQARCRSEELGHAVLKTHRSLITTGQKPDFIDDTLEEAAKHPAEYTDDLLARTAMLPFMAGLDTVASTASFMLYDLLRHPKILQRVVTEIDKAMTQGPLTWEILKQMPALHGAAMETLRLYPVAGVHMARVSQPLTYAGYRLDVGEDVIIAVTVPHFLPEIFPDPLSFDIDRYCEPRNEHRQQGAYAPFGLGDHTCLGSGIAELQLMVTVATILHTYELVLDPPDYELCIVLEPTPSPDEDLRIKVTNKPSRA